MKKTDARIIIGVIVLIILIITAILPYPVGHFKVVDWTPINNQAPQFFVKAPEIIQPIETKQISEAVDAIKKQTNFPEKVDPIVTWTNISMENEKIIYDYKLNNINLSNMSPELLRPIITNDFCNIPSIKTILATNINIMYRYKDYQDKIFASFIISKKDCI